MLAMSRVRRSDERREYLVAAKGAPELQHDFASELIGLISLTDPLRALFHFGPLHLDDLVLCLAVGLVMPGAAQAIKRLVPAPPA